MKEKQRLLSWWKKQKELLPSIERILSVFFLPVFILFLAIFRYILYFLFSQKIYRRFPRQFYSFSRNKWAFFTWYRLYTHNWNLQKPTEYCETNIPQLKINLKKKNNWNLPRDWHMVFSDVSSMSIWWYHFVCVINDVIIVVLAISPILCQ